MQPQRVAAEAFERALEPTVLQSVLVRQLLALEVIINCDQKSNQKSIIS